MHCDTFEAAYIGYYYMHYYSICIGYCAYNAEPIRPAPLGGGPRGVTKPIFLHSEEAVASLAVHPTRGVKLSVNIYFLYIHI